MENSNASTEEATSSTFNSNSTSPQNHSSFVYGQSLQDYLSLGYLYLLLLGVSSDSIYYGLIGVNILSYSSVLDVILSPVIYLTRNLVFPAVIFIIPMIMVLGLIWAGKKHVKLRENPEYRAKHDIDKLDKEYSRPGLIKKALLMGAFVIFSAYLGYGLGGGMKIKDQLETGNFKMTHTLTFSDGSQIPVRLIGHNSDYVFYVREGKKEVSVSPISGNVRMIEKGN